MTLPRHDSRHGPGIGVLALFFASGAAGLVYQVLWLRELTLIFGATAYASSAVLSTFMGGLALGSYWSGQRAERWKTPPLRAYGALELGITAYAALVPWLLGHMTPLLAWAWRLGADRHFAILGLIKFLAIAALILPATTLMGATLPVLSRVAARSTTDAGAGVGALYAVNTFGAVAGTVGAAFVALPALGMRRTLFLNLALNALVGAIAWIAGGRPRAEAVPEPRSVADSPEGERSRSGALLLAFAASGFAAMVLEVAWTRSLALVLGSSVYAYASMLTAFLVGLASGAGSAARFLSRPRRFGSRAMLSAVIASAGILSFAAAHAIQWLPRLFAEVYFRFSPSPQGWWIVQIGLALLIMFPTTYVLGWVFPLGLDVVSKSDRHIASAVGRLYASNTVGTIAGAAIAGFVLIPNVGVGKTLIGVAIGQLLLGGMLPLLEPAGRRRAPVVACATLAVLCVALRPRWDVLMMNSGVYMNIQEADPAGGWAGFAGRIRSNNQLIYAHDGLTASVLVGLQPKFDNLYLAVNGKIDASSREDLETQVMAGHLPVLFHEAPHDVLVIGLASGITVGAVATHAVDSIRVVEVEPSMVQAARRFDRFNHNALDDPRVTLSINDARNELQFNRTEYDVIVSEPSNPWMTVAANLFTEDFFKVARSRLRPGGIFGQWIQTYCLTPEYLRSILEALHRSFPHVLVFESLNGVDLLVVGSDRPLVLDTDILEKKMAELWVRADMARIGVRSALDLAGMLQTGGDGLGPVLAGAKANTDDNGRVEFAAPKALYLDTQDANMAMLQGPAPDPMETIRRLVRAPENPDLLRFELLRRWARRDQRPRASRAAGYLRDTNLKSQAEALLATSR